MTRTRLFFLIPASISALALASLSACGGGGEGGEGGAVCSVEQQTGCMEGEVCEDVQGGTVGCFAPITVQGRVFNALDDKGILGARVVARDANDAAISTVAISIADGTYSLTVPAKRDANGKPLSVNYTLRADASGFQTFPLAPRVAIPIDVATAAGTPAVVQSAATDVALIPLPSTANMGSIAGHVIADAPGGTLVVAGGSTGVADRSGAYEVFNVAAGAGVTVSAYAAGLQIKPVSADVVAGMETAGVDLTATSGATATISGKVDIVNGGGASVTSVVLALEDTFNEDAARGEVPKGLRAANVTSGFSIAGVPDGKYVVLASFENDGLVRDPDVSIGGTEIVHIVVSGGASQSIDTAFKVTGALATISPGADKVETVSGTPTLVWGDDSGEDHYEVRVFDAFGNKVWEDLNIDGVSGSAQVSVPYGGPALTSGMLYQFRATSIKNGGSPISQTEDLRGVFLYK